MEADNYKLELESQENFNLTDDEAEQFVVSFDESDDMEVDFGEVVDNGTADFNALYNRPKYNGAPMTSETDITIDSELSDESENAVENKVVTRKFDKKLNKDDSLTNHEIEELINNS